MPQTLREDCIQVVEMDVGGGPEVLLPKRKPRPRPERGEVIVRALAIGVSSADMLIRKGLYQWMPPLPAVVGNELAGLVEECGPDVDEGMRGRLVLVSSREMPHRGGCYAEAVRVPADSVFLLPDGIAPEHAVTLPNYQLAGALLHDSGIKGPRSIAVYGASGGVGSALAQLACVEGIRTIGIVSSEEKRKFARAAGIPMIVLRDDTLRDQVMELTDNKGVDVVFAHAGPSFVANLDLLAPRGTLVSFSILGGLMPQADIYGALRARLGRSLGVRVYAIHSLDGDRITRRSLMERAISLMAEGKLKPPPCMRFPLSKASDAHRLMEAGEVLGKVVLIPDAAA